MADREAVLEQFVALTGCDKHVADNYLSAHDYDLERSVDFYFEHPPDAGALPREGLHPPGLPQPAFAEGLHDEPPPLAAIDDDDELQQALAASQGARVEHAARPEAIEIMSDDEEGGEGLALMARQRAAAIEARRAAAQEMDAMHGITSRLPPVATAEMMGVADDMFRRAGIPGPSDLLRVTGSALTGPRSFPLGAEPGGPSFVADPDAPPRVDSPLGLGVGLGPRTRAGARHVPALRVEEPELHLPEGINIEEARMLEAAMLGIPYEGRIPDFANRPLPAPLDPEVEHQRLLREEQDAAYEESLALDRLKQEAEASKREEERRQLLAAQEEEQRQVEERRRAADDAAAAEQRLQEQLAAKAAALPPQPAAGELGSVMVLARLQDGSRHGRRFRTGDALSSVFDFVDVQSKGAPKPGSYRLVTQFPRQVFEHSQCGSLADCGIAADTSFFVEVI